MDNDEKKVHENKHHEKHTHKHHEKKEKKEFGMWTIILSIAAIIIIAILLFNIGKILPNGDNNDINVLARVNGEEILVEDLDIEMAKLPEYYHEMMEPLELKKNVLEQVVMKKLLLQEAEKLMITATTEEVDAEIEKTYVEYGLTKGDFMIKLEEQGTDYDQFFNDFKEQLVLNKLIESSLVKGEPTEEDIEAIYNENKEQLVSAKASHILVCYEGRTSCEQPRTEEEALEIVNEVLSKVEQEENFAELAKEYSDGPSGPLGGSLGWFNKGAMVPEFEKAAFDLKKDETSDAVKTDFGYHIIWLEDKKESLDDLRADITEQIQNSDLQANIGTYLDSLKATAEIEYITPLEMLEPVNNPDAVEVEGITTFLSGDDEICRDKEGKPLVFMFSTTWCPHCEWAKKPFDNVANDYKDLGLISVYHWQIDENDDTLTDEKESVVPAEHLAIMKKFNPRGSIPTFVFGCKYYRIGAGHEETDDKTAEEAEYRLVIEELLKESTEDDTLDTEISELDNVEEEINAGSEETDEQVTEAVEDMTEEASVEE